MTRDFFLKTERIGFSKWNNEDIKLAELLWANPEVTKFICASGKFSNNDVVSRLNTEIDNDIKYKVQYWAIFELQSNSLIGCCGLRPYDEDRYEMGYHLLPECWGKGYAVEAGNAVIDYAFNILHTKGLFARHNPNNIASKKVLTKLKFNHIGYEFYEATGLYNPLYELNK